MYWTPYIALLLLLAMPALISELRYWSKTVLFCFGALMFISFLSLLYAQIREAFPLVLIIQVGLFLVAGAASHITRTKPRLLYILLGATAIVWTAAALHAWYSPLAIGQQNLLSPLGEWNSTAALYGGLTMFSLVLALTTIKNKNAYALSALGGLGLAALWLTGSRGGTLVFIVIAPVALWLARSPWRRLLFTSATAIAVAILSVVALSLSEPAQTKSGTVLISESVVPATQLTNSTGVFARSQSATGDFGLRIKYWETSLHMAIAHPLLGTGPGSYQDEVWRYVTPSEDWPTDAHDYVFETLAEEGVPAGLVVLALLGALYVAAVRTRKKVERSSPLRPLALASAAGFLFIATHSLIDFDDRWPVIMWLAAAFIGIVAGAYPPAKRKTAHPTLLIPIVLSMFLLIAGCTYGMYESPALGRPLGNNTTFNSSLSLARAEYLLGLRSKSGQLAPLAGSALDVLEGSTAYNPGDPRLALEADVARYYAKEMTAAGLIYALEHQKLNPWIQGFIDAATAMDARGNYADEAVVSADGVKAALSLPGLNFPGLLAVDLYSAELRALGNEQKCNPTIATVATSLHTYLSTAPASTKKLGNTTLAAVAKDCPSLAPTN
jgi:O-antigen ligase